mgnify:CR=1 FL=1
MFCPKCGYEIKEEDRFCPNCGAHIIDGKVADSPNAHKSYYAKAAYDEKEKENGLISLICGIASLVVPYLNLVLAIIALVFARRCNVDENNFAKAGKITGIIGLVLSILVIFLTIVWVVMFVVGAIAGAGGGY